MYKKNTAGQFIHFQGVDASTNGIKSGVTWTVRRCIDGTFAAATGTVTEDGSTGWYKFAMSQADTNGNNIGFNFTGTGAIPQTVNIVTDGAPPAVNLTQIDGLATSGNNATLNLKKLSIVNSDALGEAVDISADGTGGRGMVVYGTAYGSVFVSDAIGVLLEGGDGNVTGEGLVVESYAADAVRFETVTDAGDKHALSLVGGDTGKSINAPQGIIGSDSEDLSVTNIVSNVWSAATRTLTAVSDSAGITTLLSRIGSALNITSGKVESNVKQINGTNVTGDGSGTPWGPA